MNSEHERECPICDGTGIRKYDITPDMTSVETCDICGGSGKLIVLDYYDWREKASK